MNRTDNLSIVGIRVDGRDDHASNVQEVLTSYGNKIIGRFGVTAPDENDGLITLVMNADDKDVNHLTAELRNIKGVSVSSMNL